MQAIAVKNVYKLHFASDRDIVVPMSRTTRIGDTNGASKKEILELAAKNDVRFLRLQFTDILAINKHVEIPASQHDKALEMIADLQHKKSQAAQMVNGRPASIVYEESIAAGRTAFDAHDYETAKTALDAAARIKPLPSDLAAMYATASQQVSKLEVAKALFKERRYQDAVTNLDPLLQADPQNQSIRRMIIAAHFDLGATALQEERLPDAMREFDEVLKSDPNDELAKRSHTLAERYSGQPKDLLYTLYATSPPWPG